MNTKIKLALLAGKSQEKGFTTVLAMGMGLISIAVGMTMIARGQSTQISAISQKATSQAGAIAEAGVTQYINFLNNNRELLKFPDCTVPRNSDGSCPDTGTAQSWSLVSNIVPPVIQSGSVCTNASTSNGSLDLTTIKNTWASTDWKSAGDGEYRLVSYNYSDSNETGILTIQAKVGNGSNQGQSQLQFQIKVNENPGVANIPIPQQGFDGIGLWAKKFNTAANAHANVLDSSGCTDAIKNNSFPASKIAKLPTQPLGSLPNGNNTPPLSNTMGQLIKDEGGTPFPPLPDYPSAQEFTTLVSEGKVNSLANCNGKTAYPANGDKDADGNVYNSASLSTTGRVYKYRITGNCTIPNNVTFGSNTGLDRVIMYIDSGLTINNNAKLGSQGTNKTKVQWLLKTANLDLGGNAQVGSSNPNASTATNWAFFLYEGTSVSLKGTADYYAFIFAPNAHANMSGNPKIGGGLWVNEFSTNGAPPKIFQAVTQSDLNSLFSDLYQDTQTELPPPLGANLIDKITGYQRQEFGNSVN